MCCLRLLTFIPSFAAATGKKLHSVIGIYHFDLRNDILFFLFCFHKFSSILNVMSYFFTFLP